MNRRSDPDARQAGRPQAIARTAVHDDLLKALRECLRCKMHSELTLKEVAQRAGTSPEMVRYYFGGKDGLIVALLRQTAERFSRMMADLERDILRVEGSPTQHIIHELLMFYLDERHVTRVSIAEFNRNTSRIAEEFLHSRSEVVVGNIHGLIAMLVESGYYDPAVDPRRLAMTILAMVTGPVTFLAVLPDKWVSEKDLGGDEWAAYLADLIDSRWARAPVTGTGGPSGAG